MSDNAPDPHQRPRRDRIIALVVFLIGVGLVVGYGIWEVFLKAPVVVEEPAPTTQSTNGKADIAITVEGEANGTIYIDLFEDVAPQHAERIATLARDGAYAGVVFHRVIEGFMAQSGDVLYGKMGGDMRRAGMGGSDYPDLPAEFSEVSFDRGIVGMARSQNPNSANSQFFIMFEPGEFLNGQYTVVGQVVDGMDVVDAIKLGKGPNGSVIGQPDVMTKVTVVE